MADTVRSERPRCTLCDKLENLKRCSKCHSVYYCGRDHQIQDWSKHKNGCQKLKQNKTKANTTETDDNAQSHTRTFDKRPLKLINAIKPESYDTEFLCRYAAKQLEAHQLCVIDDLMSSDDCDSTLQDVFRLEKSDCFKPGQLAGGRTSGQDDRKVTETSIRSDKITWLQGTENEYPSISKMVSLVDGLVAGLNKHFADKYYINGRTKAMVACYPGGGTAYTRHVDNPSKDGRLITCIVYLNRHWNTQKDGGVLRIFPGDVDDYVDVEPNMNRLLLFWSDFRNPHEVQPAHKARYAITMWYFDQLERQKAKEDELHNEMNAIRGEIALMEIRTKEIEKASIEQRIDNEAQKAISSLSDEELQAISSLIKGHPDPSSVLTKLGINGKIQQALIQHINART